MAEYTHAQLVNVARKWLARECVVVMTELTSGSYEHPDALGFRSDGHSILIECKASLADFKSDSKKHFRQHAEMGAGAERYYFSSPGVIPELKLPDGWGLLVWDGRRVRTIMESSYFENRNHAGEKRMLISCLRRFYRPEVGGVMVRCYTITSDRRPRAALGIQPPE